MILKRGLLLVVSGVFLLGLAACGKKGPPFLPKASPHYSVTQLMAERMGGNIILSGRLFIQEESQADSRLIAGCRVYHVRYDKEDPPCESCPIRYRLLEEIMGQVIFENRFYCEIPLSSKTGLHFFEVRLINENGEAGPPSDSALLTLE